MTSLIVLLTGTPISITNTHTRHEVVLLVVLETDRPAANDVNGISLFPDCSYLFRMQCA